MEISAPVELGAVQKNAKLVDLEKYCVDTAENETSKVCYYYMIKAREP